MPILLPSHFSQSSLTRPARALALLLLLALQIGDPSAARAADATWTGGTGNQAWSTFTNWSSNPNPPPGDTTGTTNANTATFNTATAGTNVTIDAGRNLKSLTFGSSAGLFTIGNSTVNTGEALHLSSTGAITLQSGALSTITFNAPLILEPASSTTAGTFSFTNSATAAATVAATPKLNFAGNISGGTTSAAVTLTLAGSVGTRGAVSPATALDQANTISGTLSDGNAAGGLAVTINGSTTSPAFNAWNLTGQNTYSGATTITAGALYFNNIAPTGQASALGTGSKGTISLGGFLIYTGGAASTNRTITGNGGTLQNNGTGTLTLEGTVTTNSSITLRGSSNLTITGLITGAGGVSKTNSSVLILSNTGNNFAGNLAVNAGIVSIASIANKTLASAAGAGSSISFGQNQTSENIATLRFTGANGGASNRDLTLGAGAANTALAPAGAVLENTVSGQTLTLSGTFRSSGSVATYFGSLELAGAGHGVMSGVIGGLTGAGLDTTPTNVRLIKSGLGTWEVSNANIYYGTTTVSAGTLLVTGSLNGTTGVSVAGNATLGGSGTIRPGNGDIANISNTAQVSVAASGILAPGGASTIEDLAIDSSTSTATNILSLASTARIQLKLGASFQSDRISLLNGSAGDILFGGNNAIDFTDLTGGALSYGNYTLFSANVNGAYTGLGLSGQTITSGLTIGTGLNAYAGSTLEVSGRDIVLHLVPEPASAVLLLSGLGFLLGRRRR